MPPSFPLHPDFQLESGLDISARSDKSADWELLSCRTCKKVNGDLTGCDSDSHHSGSSIFLVGSDSVPFYVCNAIAAILEQHPISSVPFLISPQLHTVDLPQFPHAIPQHPFAIMLASPPPFLGHTIPYHQKLLA